MRRVAAGNLHGRSHWPWIGLIGAAGVVVVAALERLIFGYRLRGFSQELWSVLNRFDFAVIHVVNSFSARSFVFDTFMRFVSDSNLLKGGACMAIVVWAWFREEEPRSEKREILLFSLVSSVFALLVGRALSLAVPFRIRPMHNVLLQFRMPLGTFDEPHSWNSMPSDHAVLFFCLAMSLWFVSRRLGFLAFCQAIFIVCFPRVYLGFHYPSDLIMGALLGIAIAFTAKIEPLRKNATRVAFVWLEKSPASFYAFFFLVLFEFAELFTSVLMAQGFARHVLRHLF